MMVDLIVENGRIHTGDPGAPPVEAVAVLNGRIVAAGNDVEGLRARERVDAHDRVVLPGFNDAHAHSVWFGMTLIETDLSGVRSLDDLYRIIGDRARDGGADEWIVACGFNPVLLHGAVPDRDVLDRVSSLPVAFSSDRPVAPGAPLGGIQAFIERITEDGLPYGPDERLTAGQAVRAATEGSSQVTGQHARKGLLVVGQLADMVFLQEHPADVAVEDIHSIPVLATAVGGVFTHRQSGF